MRSYTQSPNFVSTPSTSVLGTIGADQNMLHQHRGSATLAKQFLTDFNRNSVEFGSNSESGWTAIYCPPNCGWCHLEITSPVPLARDVGEVNFGR